MIKDNKVYYRQDLIDSFETDELDGLFQDFIGFDYTKHDYPVETTGDLKKARGIGYPMYIDDMIDKLKAMKEKGATHISLEYHEDHISYMIEAWRILKAEERDINEFKKRKAERERIAKEKLKLELRSRLESLEDD